MSDVIHPFSICDITRLGSIRGDLDHNSGPFCLGASASLFLIKVVLSNNMSGLVPVLIIGGSGGSSFCFDGRYNGATLKKIWVWVGGWQVKAIEIWLTDGENQLFGQPEGEYYEFKFKDGEYISSLSLWGNGAGTRLGAIKFETSHSNKFFVYMTSWGLKTEYPVNVGSGICLGVMGRSGADIDSLGFIFINDIKSSVLTNVNYPTLHQVTPQIATEEIKSLTYTNNSDLTQSFSVETSKTLFKKSSWSVTNKLEQNFNIQVKAGIPNIVEFSAGFSLTMGVENRYELENSEEKKETFTFKVEILPRKTALVHISIGRATVDLPYTGIVEVTCKNGDVLRFNTSGTYNGILYTNSKATVTQK
ncbi:aerolysin-like protein [Betta splendens]|uniref:Aerolysin-like protein n=1 Tax=Betta splendens TaxID=158456 RepID=A0A6P7N6D9_BETSP|nr:aerolysin-like protein [Betta splendens]